MLLLLHSPDNSLQAAGFLVNIINSLFTDNLIFKIKPSMYIPLYFGRRDVAPPRSFYDGNIR